jgi:hypothetical protein
MATIKPYYVVPEKYNTILLEEKGNQETEDAAVSLPFILQSRTQRVRWDAIH